MNGIFLPRPNPLESALDDIDRLLLTSSPTVGERRADHQNVVATAAALEARD